MANKKYDPVASELEWKRGEELERAVSTSAKLKSQAKADLIKKGKYNPAEFAKNAKDTDSRIDDLRKENRAANAISDAPTPEMRDQLMTDKNNRAAAAYEKRRAEGQDFKKGGMVKSAKNKSASSRADGCAIRGKTRA